MEDTSVVSIDKRALVRLSTGVSVLGGGLEGKDLYPAGVEVEG